MYFSSRYKQVEQVQNIIKNSDLEGLTYTQIKEILVKRNRIPVEYGVDRYTAMVVTVLRGNSDYFKDQWQTNDL